MPIASVSHRITRAPVFFDLDGCLLHSVSHGREASTLKHEEGRHPLIRLLKKDIPIVVVTHSPWGRVEERLVSPIREGLIINDSLYFIRNFMLYVDGGTDRFLFNESGESYQLDDGGSFRAQFELVDPYLSCLEASFREAVSLLGQREEELEIKRLGRVRISMRPIYGSFAEKVSLIVSIEENLRKTVLGKEVIDSCLLIPTKTTIHALSKKMRKGAAVRDALKLLGLAVDLEHPVFCFGNESLDREYGGRIFPASDISFLDCSGTVLMAVDDNQFAVEKASKQNNRVFPAGVGPDAVYDWLKLFAR